MIALALWLALHGPVIDRVVAVVGDEAVLASDVRIEAALDAVDQPRLPIWSVREPDPALRALQAAAVRLAAGTTSVYQPSRAALDARFEAVRGQFELDAQWQAFLAAAGAGEGDVRTALKRRMIVEAWVHQRVDDPDDDLNGAAAWAAAVDAEIHAALARVRVRSVDPVPR